ncbi:MAG: hypothetical protein RLZZ292_4067 [Bacteroidota bacterium]|jgi:hypothetical protein
MADLKNYFMAGFKLKNSNGEVEIETSNGIVLVETYTVDSFFCLGNVKPNFSQHRI